MSFNDESPWRYEEGDIVCFIYHIGETRVTIIGKITSLDYNFKTGNYGYLISGHIKVPEKHVIYKKEIKKYSRRNL